MGTAKALLEEAAAQTARPVSWLTGPARIPVPLRVFPGLATGVTTPGAGVTEIPRARPVVELVRVPSSGLPNGEPRPLIPGDGREPIAMRRRAPQRRG